SRVNEPMDPPPHRLVLAAMPAEQLPEQPARVVRWIAVRRVDGGDARVRQPLNERLRSSLRLGQLGWQGVLASHRARYRKTGQLGELSSSLLEPIAQSQGA